MVCQDLFETESAAFWKREGVDPATIGTEVFFLPAAAIAEKAGTLTNTMRLVQFHEKAVDAPDDAHSDLSLAFNLGKRLKALYADSTKATDRPILDMTWNTTPTTRRSARARSLTSRRSCARSTATPSRRASR